MDNQDQTTQNFSEYPDRERIDKITVDLMTNNLQNLIHTYGHEHLFREIFTQNENFNSVVLNVEMYLHGFILIFWPKNQPVLLTPQQRIKTVNAIASVLPEHTDEQIQAWLKEIDPNLILPSNFDRQTCIKKAKALANASNIIETLMLENFAGDYLPDALNFYKKSDTELQNLSIKIDDISMKFEEQYKKLLVTPNPYTFKINDTLINKAVDLLGKLNRTPLYLAEERKKKDWGNLASIFNRLTFSIKIAQDLKKLQLKPEDLNTVALEEIKKAIKPNLQI